MISFAKGDDGRLYVWSLKSGRIIWHLSTKQGPITALEWLCVPHDPQNSCLITAGADGTLKLWRHNESVSRSVYDWPQLKYTQMTFASLVGTHSVFDVAVENMAIYQNKIAVVGGGRLAILQVDIEIDQQSLSLGLHRD